MSEHKTNISNWTPAQKKLYRERRTKGLRGQAGYAIVVERVFDKKGKFVELIPVSGKRPPQSNRNYHYQSLKELQRQQKARNEAAKATKTKNG